MREKLLVIKTNTTDKNEIALLVEPETNLSEVKATGQMLVDSDGLSFVYVLEINDEYTYLAIKEDFWPELKRGMDSQANVYLSNSTEQLELENFFEELEYLVENIKGNGNYGEEMVAKVEACF
ncbi:hypothetical protein EKG37_14325 [Robertmurraya yapensis]|uniref:Uncharacterized protein n=2 Tax=Bacillaceae TaxID=186817 RepID=A0A3S0KMF7_9BACI|nr:hypothetical protein [Bacillus yapensis]RTR30069.1 hypothetical protein EKG37_14325 [Bacillus yapensis]TKS95150.1 hypothetical protein FAR12_14325 [Bacillus yapensis]